MVNIYRTPQPIPFTDSFRCSCHPPAAPQGPPFVAKSRSLPRAPHLRPWPETETIWGRSGQNPWKVCKTNLTNEKTQGKTAFCPGKYFKDPARAVSWWKLWVCMHPHAQAPPWCYSADGSILSQASQPEQPGSSGRISHGSYPSVCQMANMKIEKLWLAQGTVANKQFSAWRIMKVFGTNHMLEIGKTPPIDGKHRRSCVTNSASGTMRLN